MSLLAKTPFWHLKGQRSPHKKMAVANALTAKIKQLALEHIGLGVTVRNHGYSGN